MFFKKENVLKSDQRHWDIFDISNGIKCLHSSNLHEEYFEYDEIEAVNAFEANNPMSVIDLFDRLMIITPETKGFAYNQFNIIAKIDKVTQKPKGFVIRPRRHAEKSDIDKKTTNNKEIYVSVETLKATNMVDFVDIILLPKQKDDKLQQILDPGS